MIRAFTVLPFEGRPLGLSLSDITLVSLVECGKDIFHNADVMCIYATGLATVYGNSTGAEDYLSSALVGTKYGVDGLVQVLSVTITASSQGPVAEGSGRPNVASSSQGPQGNINPGEGGISAGAAVGIAVGVLVVIVLVVFFIRWQRTRFVDEGSLKLKENDSLGETLEDEAEYGSHQYVEDEFSVEVPVGRRVQVTPVYSSSVVRWENVNERR